MMLLVLKLRHEVRRGSVVVREDFGALCIPSGTVTRDVIHVGADLPAHPGHRLYDTGFDDNPLQE